jgi:anti-anti-sigma factor
MVFMEEKILEISEEINEDICRFFVKGRIDSNSAGMLLEKMEEAVNAGHKNIILNMYKIDYLSSIGIRNILKIYKQTTENGGKFNIERPSEIVKNVLGMVALKELLVIN